MKVVTYNLKKYIRHTIMTTKLTLRLDKTLIADAKVYAQSHGRSVSVLVADYFAQLTRQPPELPSVRPMPPAGKLTARLRGALQDKSGKGVDVEEYQQHLEAKYQ